MGSIQGGSEGGRKGKLRGFYSVSNLLRVFLFNLNILHKHGEDRADAVQVVDVVLVESRC